MNRDYEKIIAEYEQRFGNKDNDIIYVSDLKNIKDNNDDLYGYISNAIKYGVIIGYRYAKNEQYKKSALRKKAERISENYVRYMEHELDFLMD